jgi:hypothetical protein
VIRQQIGAIGKMLSGTEADLEVERADRHRTAGQR